LALVRRTVLDDTTWLDSAQLRGARRRIVMGMAYDRITIEPDKMDGQPCIRGLRFPVVTVLRMVAGGMTAEDILREHPDLQAEDIPAALRYAAEALAEHYYPLRPPA
jgi:uncharacterized protein (DUF433 family)